MQLLNKCLIGLVLNSAIMGIACSQDFHLDLTNRSRIGFFTSQGENVIVDRNENGILPQVFDTVFYLANSTIINKAQFQAETFTAYSSFYRTQFSQAALFDASIFKGLAWFAYSSFHNAASFRNCRFRGHATFMGTQFDGPVDFSNDSIMATIQMSDARFKQTADFSNIYLAGSGSIDFENASMPDTINFSRNTKLESIIDLSNINFGTDEEKKLDNKGSLDNRKILISLYKTDVSKFHLDYLHFRLLLTDPKTNKLLPDDEIRSVYEAVLKNFKDRGQTDSYEMLDVEYQDFKWSKNRYFSWFGWFLHRWNRYGHKNELPLLWTIALFTLLSSATFFLLNYLNKDVLTMTKVPQLPPLSAPFLSAAKLSRRFWYSCVYTSRVFFPIKIPWECLNPNKVLGTIYIVLIYLTGLLCLGYIANFIFQKLS